MLVFITKNKVLIISFGNLTNKQWVHCRKWQRFMITINCIEKDKVKRGYAVNVKVVWIDQRSLKYMYNNCEYLIQKLSWTVLYKKIIFLNGQCYHQMQFECQISKCLWFEYAGESNALGSEGYRTSNKNTGSRTVK